MLGKAEFTKKMVPVADGNLCKHSTCTCAQCSVYSEGINSGFMWSGLRGEMLIVG